MRLELARWTDCPGHRLDLRPFDRAPSAVRYRPGLLSNHPSAVHSSGAVDA